MKSIPNTIWIIILLILMIFIVELPQTQKVDDGTCLISIPEKSKSKLLLLGTNLGVWGDDWYWSANEPFVKNSGQRKLAKDVIGSFRFPCRDLSDKALLTVLDKIEEVGAIPFVVLPENDDERAEHVVKLFGDRVLYYEYGNEVDWFNDIQPEQHAEMFCNEYPRLKSINPNINIGGPTQSNTDPEWMRRFLKHQVATCPDVKPDFISYHKYWAYGTETNEKIFSSLDNFGDEIEAIRQVVIDIYGEDIPHIISEWNWHAVPENYNDNRDMDEEFMREFTSRVLDVMEEHNVYMAHQYCYGSGCGDGHLDMLSGSEPKSQYLVFLDKLMDLCPECYNCYLNRLIR